MPVTAIDLKKKDLRVKDLAIFLENNSNTLSREELYEVILVLGRLEQRTSLAKKLVAFLKIRSDQIKEEVKSCDHSSRCPFNPHEMVIVYLLRMICNRSCSKALTAICTKILIRLGYSVYSDVSRFKYKVYRMNVGKDGTLKELAKAVDYEFSDTDPQHVDKDDCTEVFPHLSPNDSPDFESTIQAESDAIFDDDRKDPDIQVQCNKYVDQYLKEINIGQVIRDEIHNAFTQEIIPLIKSLIPTVSSSTENTNSSYTSTLNKNENCDPIDKPLFPSNPLSVLPSFQEVYNSSFPIQSVTLTDSNILNKSTLQESLSQSGIEDTDSCQEGNIDKSLLIQSSNGDPSFSYFSSV